MMQEYGIIPTHALERLLGLIVVASLSLTTARCQPVKTGTKVDRMHDNAMVIRLDVKWLHRPDNIS